MNDPAPSSRPRWRTLAPWIVIIAVLAILPQLLDELWVTRVTGWIPLAIAALGLNLLTGYNGQISVGHGALYGLGAYAGALIVNAMDGNFALGVVLAAIVCFVAGVLIGLPALRIKGLYLALVTLAVATMFPDLIKQFEGVTGGSQGLRITAPQPYRGTTVDELLEWKAPGWSGLADDQWRFYVFAALAVVCFWAVRNLVDSRIGRSLVAIRDNEVAAEVNGVAVARVKVITFGLSAALAGIGGALFALLHMQVSPSSFTITASLFFLIAVVIGGPATVIGPAIGAVFYGFFDDVVTRGLLPERFKPATPLILGIALIVLMLMAPGGIMGIVSQFTAKRRLRNAPSTGREVLP
jgi:branched-chain amino acid transport system permease protein